MSKFVKDMVDLYRKLSFEKEASEKLIKEVFERNRNEFVKECSNILFNEISFALQKNIEEKIDSEVEFTIILYKELLIKFNLQDIEQHDKDVMVELILDCLFNRLDSPLLGMKILSSNYELKKFTIGISEELLV